MTIQDQVSNKPIDLKYPRLVEGLIIDDQLPVDGSVILLHPREPRWALANTFGQSLLPRFDGNTAVDDLIDELAENYDNVPREQIEGDLKAFLIQLQQCNMVENAPLPRPPRKKLHETPSLTIYLTEQCNLRCKHCAIVEGKMPDPKLTTEKIKALVEEHTQRFDNPVISFLGGEPLLQPDCLELIRYARERTDQLILGTNGLLIDDELAAELAALDFRIQISLDGVNKRTHEFIRGRGTYEKTWETVDRLVAHGAAPRLTIATVLTRCALEDVDELIERCDSRGVHELRFLPLNKTGAATTHWDKIHPEPEQLKRVLRYLLFDAPTREGGRTTLKASFPGFVPNTSPNSDHWCPLGKTFIIDSQGLVYTCPALTIPDVTVGNVMTENLETISTSAKTHAAREAMNNRVEQVEDCRVCAWRNFCRGGCTAFMAHQSGSLLANDGYCDFRRDLYREFVLRRVGLWPVEDN